MKNLLVIIFIIILLGCTSNSTENYPLAKGTVKYISLEGGFYGIITGKNEHLDPINLPKEFQVDGKRVIFSYKERKDLASFHMWGIIIEILDINPE